jgi:superfamily II DNA/RNA helicase
MTADTITQYIVRIPTSDPKAKRAALRALMSRTDVRNVIVFCNRKSEVDIVAKSLKTHGFDAAAIHGDLDQSHRTKTLADFRSGALKILVASDVAARGLDIPDVSHVFNYDVSHHADDYVHRIGRTGRAGKLGQAFMIVTPADDKSLDKVLKLIKMDPQELVLDDIDFDAIKDGGRDDKRSSRSNETRSGGRGRSRAAEPAQAPAPAVALAETDAAEAPTRSRSRRKAKPEVSVETVVEPEMAPVVEKPAGRGRSRARSEPRPEAKIEPRIESRIEAEPAPSEEARAARTDREPQLRQSDRRGERRPEERERSGVKGFGDDIPAFLRRPVVIRA